MPFRVRYTASLRRRSCLPPPRTVAQSPPIVFRDLNQQFPLYAPFCWPPERPSSGYFHFKTKMLFISFALVLSQVYKEVLPEAAGHVLNVEAERRIQLPPIKPDRRTDKGKTTHPFHDIFLTCWLVLENAAMFCFSL